MALYPTGVKYRGLNRAGAEYGDEWDGWNGQTFYDVPPKPTLAAELNHYAVKGFNTLRLPISWERLQHNLNGPLDAGYQKQITSFVTQANSGGWTVIIDLHNYNRYATGAFDATGNQVGSYTQETMGKGVLTIAHLIDVWTRLARLFKSKPKVIFNLMNEPHDFPIHSDNWFAHIQTLMDAIRAVGAKQMILVPNSRGSDVDHWDKWPPNGGRLDSVAALAITDNASNYAFDMHAYCDSPASATDYVDLVTKVTNWAITNGRKLFLSELGIQNGEALGAAALGNLLSYLDSNSNVWVGWTTWNLPPYNITKDGDYTADDPAMAWYTPHLTPNIVKKK